jgi:hypothetical protein
MKKLIRFVAVLSLAVTLSAQTEEAPVAEEQPVSPEAAESTESKTDDAMVPPAVAADDENKIQWTVDVGQVTVEGKQWFRVSLRPDIPIGKFGVCLDLELFVDDSGKFSDKGWRFKNSQEAFESISRKIYYLRYGRPGHQYYGKVGSLDNVTLGYGLIMYDYANTLQYPDIRKTGLHFELNDLSALRVGIQGVINNFQDFQNGGALIGTRLYIKPLSTLKIPVLSSLTFAGSYVSDFNQRAVLTDADDDKVPDWLDKSPYDKNWAIEKPDFSEYDTADAGAVAAIDTLMDRKIKMNAVTVTNYSKYIDKKDPFAIAGADIGLPIISGKFFNLDVYGQYATTLDKKDDQDPIETSGWGITAPGVMLKVGKFFGAKLEYRYFKDQFEAEYFDRTYELNRMFRSGDELFGKEAFLLEKDSSTLSGIFGRANFNIKNIVDVGASYQWMKYTRENAGADTLGLPETDQSFTAEARIGKTIRDVLNKVKIDDISYYYNKKNIGTWVVGDEAGKPVYDKFLEPTPTVITGYKVGFKMSESMVLYYDQQYSYEPDGTPENPYKLKSVSKLMIGTQIKF